MAVNLGAVGPGEGTLNQYVANLLPVFANLQRTYNPSWQSIWVQ